MEQKQPEKKRRGKRHVLVGGILLLLLYIGCATPTPSPTPTSDTEATKVAMARALEATMTALAPTVTNTPLPTDTPTPTNTLTRTPTQTLTPSTTPTDIPPPTTTPTTTPRLVPVVAPGDWISRTVSSGLFSVYYPASWEIKNEEAELLAIGPHTGEFLGVTLGHEHDAEESGVLLEEDSELILELLAAQVASTLQPEQSSRVVSKWTWGDGFTRGFAVEWIKEASIKGASASMHSVQTWLVWPDGTVIVGMSLRMATHKNVTMTESERQLALAVMRSVRPGGVIVPRITTTPTATAVPTETLPPSATPIPRPTSTPLPLVVPMNQNFREGIWTWNLYQLKKRKAVYWYGEATVAQGNWLLVFIQFTNTSSGSAQPYRIQPFYLIDGHGNKHPLSGAWTVARNASIAARWQFQTGLVWDTFNPGQVLGTVEAWDLPDGSGNVYLRLGAHTIYLGNFDELALEE